jgi:hypothetical protein
MTTALFLLGFLLLHAVEATIYLSVFGSDSNDGSSPASAVATLTRAVSLTSNGGDIVFAAGVLPLGQVTITKSLTLRGANAGSGQPALFQFACASGSDQLIVYGATVTVVGISFSGCQQAINVGTTSYSSSHSVTLDTVLFIGNQVDVLIGDGRSTFVAQRTTFTGAAAAVRYCTIYGSSYTTATVTLNGSSITTSPSQGIAVDTSNSCSNGNVYSSASSLTVTGTKFTSSVAGARPAFIRATQVLKLDSVSFLGPADSPQCPVLIAGTKALVSNVVFDSLTGSPALCITNSVVNVINAQFTRNAGNQTAGAYIGAGIYVAGGSTVGVSDSSFNGNTVYNADGAGIHCEMSRLTVGSSSFTYNKASTAAACSQFGCTVVQFNNTLSRNQQQAPGNACW